jgi:hypothetical protein
MTSNQGQPTQTFASIAIDIGKDVFHIVGFDTSGKVVLRKKFKRLALEAELAKLPPSIVGLEACLSAHFVSRTLRRLGHVRLQDIPDRLRRVAARCVQKLAVPTGVEPVFQD